MKSRCCAWTVVATWVLRAWLRAKSRGTGGRSPPVPLPFARNQARKTQVATTVQAQHLDFILRFS